MSSDQEASATVKTALTDVMVEAFWKSKPRKFREKWETRMRNPLAAKRRFQLMREMMLFFAKQGGEMEDVAKQKRAEFKSQLDKTYQQVAQLQTQVEQGKQVIEQLKGAVEAIDRLLAATHPTKAPAPHLSLVPKAEEGPKLEMMPEAPKDGA